MNYLSKLPASKIKNKNILLRMDFNSADSWRIEAAVPTLRKLLKCQANKVFIVSHKGRPSGFEQKYSLKDSALKLGKIAKEKCFFSSYQKDLEAMQLAGFKSKEKVVVLENIRFFEGEEKNDIKFARQLASNIDFYVNDAFSVSHRKAASVCAITQVLPSYAGLLLEKEIAGLSKLLVKPKKPFTVIVGGGKAADKLLAVINLSKIADRILLAGVCANTLLKIRGEEVGDSMIDDSPKNLPIYKKILKIKNVILPVDVAYRGDSIFDVGPLTADLYSKFVASSKTLLWGGPLGLTEEKPFDEGSKKLLRSIGSNKSCYAVCGGGETVEFVRKSKKEGAFKFVSTGGGAMLEFLAGESLPGIKSLR